MKILKLPLLLMALPLFLLSCSKDNCKSIYTYIHLEPVYMDKSELEKPIYSSGPEALKEPGKIWFYNGYLLVNEKNKGIHIIDNTNPAYPVNVKFINIPANIDLAVKGNYLYADSYVDLVVLDLSNLDNVSEVHRVKDAVKQRKLGVSPDDPNKVIVDYLEIEKTDTVYGDCDVRGGNQGWALGMELNSGGRSMDAGNFSPTSGGNTGVSKGGSMARFTIVGDYLYTIDNSRLEVFSISNPSFPSKASTVNVGFGIETIFPYQNKLFIGATNGMYIYDARNPANPTRLSRFLHVNSCDPVVAEGDYAYVTLRGGNRCMGFNNQLEVIDISNPSAPALVKIYPLTSPYGLGIDNGILFVCDGHDGLKVYDTKDKLNIDKNMLAHFKNINTYDVIPFQNVLMMTSHDGIYQYDYSDVKNIRLLSRIPIN